MCANECRHKRCDYAAAASLGNQQWQGDKSIHYSLAVPRSGKTLEQLLQHHAGRENRLAGFEGPSQPFHLRRRRRDIAAQRQRPYAGINKQAQLGVRSAVPPPQISPYHAPRNPSLES